MAQRPCAHSQAGEKPGKVKHTADLSKEKRHLAVSSGMLGGCSLQPGGLLLPVGPGSAHNPRILCLLTQTFPLKRELYSRP